MWPRHASAICPPGAHHRHTVWTLTSQCERRTLGGVEVFDLPVASFGRSCARPFCPLALEQFKHAVGVLPNGAALRALRDVEPDQTQERDDGAHPTGRSLR